MVITLCLSLFCGVPTGLLLLAWFTEGEEVAASGIIEEGQRW